MKVRVRMRQRAACHSERSEESLEFCCQLDEILRYAQDDMKTAQDDMKTAQDDMKTAQDDMKTAQDDMKTAQDDMKTAQNDLTPLALIYLKVSLIVQQALCFEAGPIKSRQLLLGLN